MPRTVDPKERIEEIAGAVRRVLERKGVEAVTMRSVAEELGSTTGLLMHWVPNRAELLHLALNATANEQGERALASFESEPGDLAAALEQWLPLDDQRCGEMKVWIGFWALAINDPSLRAEHRDRYRGFRLRIAAHLRSLGMTDADARIGADHIVSTVDGIAVAAVFDPDHWTPARQRKQLRHLLALALS